MLSTGVKVLVYHVWMDSWNVLETAIVSKNCQKYVGQQMTVAEVKEQLKGMLKFEHLSFFPSNFRFFV